MKNIVLAAALALIAVPALAVGPESFTVDVSRGYAVEQPTSSSSQAQARSNWAPRGQQASEQASSSEDVQAAKTVKASGKSRHRNRAAAPHAKKAPAAAPAATPAK